MKRKILLPTDFSNSSWHAIKYALELYKEDECDFYILNVFTAPGNTLEVLMNMESGSETYTRIKEESKKELSKILDKLIINKEGNPKHHFKTISAFNNPIEGIKDIVEKKDIEMIVMGTRGENKTKLSSFGSTAVYVMEKIRNCPVIVVPENADGKLPKEIVFPTSYKTHYKKRELIYLIDIAKKCDAKIAILHVSEEENLSKNQKERKAMLEEYFEDVPYEFHNVFHYYVEPAVSIFVESRKSDMIAFINKKHSFFNSIFTNAMVKEITFHTNVPILVMHDLRN